MIYAKLYDVVGNLQGVAGEIVRCSDIIYFVDYHNDHATVRIIVPSKDRFLLGEKQCEDVMNAVQDKFNVDEMDVLWDVCDEFATCKRANEIWSLKEGL